MLRPFVVILALSVSYDMFPSTISEPIKILNLALPAAAVLYSSFRARIKPFADSSGGASRYP